MQGKEKYGLEVDFLEKVREEVSSGLSRFSEAYVKKLESLARKRVCIPFPEVSEKRNIIIAEIKNRSPSNPRGWNRKLTLKERLRAYESGGAGVISVITESRHFGGSMELLAKVRSFTPLPILVKDFVIYKEQILEAKAHGGDGILLIVALHTTNTLKNILNYAHNLGLWSILEVHTREELKLALKLKDEKDLIGINTRNLHSLKTDLNVAVELSSCLPPSIAWVAESGIRGKEDIVWLKEKCMHTPSAYLVGSALMISHEPENLVKEMVEA